MAHFAELDNDNRVTRVLVVANKELLDNGVESEALGVAFLTSLCGHGRWKQTSYHANIRKNFAGVGMAYDAARDAFIPQKPFPSWTLDEATCRWAPPVPRPAEGATHWDEDAQAWVA